MCCRFGGGIAIFMYFKTKSIFCHNCLDITSNSHLYHFVVYDAVICSFYLFSGQINVSCRKYYNFHFIKYNEQQMYYKSDFGLRRATEISM